MISKGLVEKTPLKSILAPVCSETPELRQVDSLPRLLFFICHTTHRDRYGDKAIWRMLIIKMTTDTIYITFFKNHESH